MKKLNLLLIIIFGILISGCSAPSTNIGNPDFSNIAFDDYSSLFQFNPINPNTRSFSTWGDLYGINENIHDLEKIDLVSSDGSVWKAINIAKVGTSYLILDIIENNLGTNRSVLVDITTNKTYDMTDLINTYSANNIYQIDTGVVLKSKSEPIVYKINLEDEILVPVNNVEFDPIQDDIYVTKSGHIIARIDYYKAKFFPGNGGPPLMLDLGSGEYGSTLWNMRYTRDKIIGSNEVDYIIDLVNKKKGGIPLAPPNQ